MPYQEYVDPELFFTDGFTWVYHCYDDGMVLAFHYQMFSGEGPTGWTAFDIRDVRRELGLPVCSSFKHIVKKAIEVTRDEGLPLVSWLIRHELDDRGEG